MLQSCPQRSVAALCNSVNDPENNINLYRRFLNLRHRRHSHGHFDSVILVICGRGLPQESTILSFAKPRKKNAFYPNCTKHPSASPPLRIHRQQTICWNSCSFTPTKLSIIYRHKLIVTYWVLMQHEALLTIQTKLKLAINIYIFLVLLFGRDRIR